MLLPSHLLFELYLLDVKRMKKINDFIFKYLINPVVKVTGVALLLVILLQIFGRMFMKRPPAWTEEMSRFIFLWYCFLGCAVTLRHKQHLGLDYFYLKMGKKAQYIIDLCIQVLTIVFGIYCAVYGTQLLEIVTKRVAPITRLSMRYFYLVLPIMGILFVLLGLENLIDLLKNRSKSEEVAQS